MNQIPYPEAAGESILPGSFALLSSVSEADSDHLRSEMMEEFGSMNFNLPADSSSGTRTHSLFTIPIM